MQYIFYPEKERGFANHGWLKAKHSFSFANWYNPDKMNFGALRVLNDDIVAPHMGFGMHPHENMEIITIPLSGKLRHQDSMGHTATISAGQIQVMSAGTGILHSEMNPSKEEEVSLFQIWIIPNKMNVEPRYDEVEIDYNKAKTDFLQLISPSPTDEGSWIHQNAWIFLREIEHPQTTETIVYKLRDPKNGVFLMNIEGEFSTNSIQLKKRDAIGIAATNEIEININTPSRLLIIEIPLHF